MATAPTSSPIDQTSDEVQRLNRWIYEIIRAYIKGRTLEIGSGTNSLWPLFLEDNRPIHLSDTNQFHIQTLRQTCNGNQFVRAVHNFDFLASDFQQSHSETLNVFDTVLALNCPAAGFEKMVGNIKYVLRSGGTFAMILPIYTSIYHGLNQNLDDWKRYNAKAIQRILMYNFSMLKVRYLNLPPDTVKNRFRNPGLSALLTVRKN